MGQRARLHVIATEDLLAQSAHGCVRAARAAGDPGCSRAERADQAVDAIRRHDRRAGRGIVNVFVSVAVERRPLNVRFPAREALRPAPRVVMDLIERETVASVEEPSGRSRQRRHDRLCVADRGATAHRIAVAIDGQRQRTRVEPHIACCVTVIG